MPRFVTVVPHLPVADVARRYRLATDPVTRRHWQVVWLVAQGQQVSVVAPVVAYTPSWVRAIIHRYNTGGPDRLGDQRQHNPGHPPRLSPGLRTELAAALTAPPPDGGFWTSVTVAAWMAQRLDRPVAPARGWETLRALGFTLHRRR